MSPHTAYYHVPSIMFPEKHSSNSDMNTTPDDLSKVDQQSLCTSSDDEDNSQAHYSANETADGDFSSVRKVIRKQQNRDSARRCRQKRKTQMTALFDLLRQQKKMIQTLEKKIECVSHTISTRGIYPPGQMYPGYPGFPMHAAGMGCVAGNQQQFMSPMGYNPQYVGNQQGYPGASMPMVIPSGTPNGNVPQQNGSNKVPMTPKAQKPPLASKNVRVPQKSGNGSPKNHEGNTENSILQFDGFHMPDFGFYDQANLAL